MPRPYCLTFAAGVCPSFVKHTLYGRQTTGTAHVRAQIYLASSIGLSDV